MQGTGILQLDRWRTPASYYAERQVGNYRLRKSGYPVGKRYKYYCMDGYVYYETGSYLPMMLLQEYRDGEWHDWMIDDPINYRAIQKYAEAAEGNVITTGLGLGLMVHEVEKNPKVKTITIVERSPEVIGLVWPYICYCQKPTLVIADFWDYLRTDEGGWDMAMIDLWVTKGKEEHDRVYREEVEPYMRMFGEHFKDAKIVVHGFQDASDVKLAEPYFNRSGSNGKETSSQQIA